MYAIVCQCPVLCLLTINRSVALPCSPYRTLNNMELLQQIYAQEVHFIDLINCSLAVTNNSQLIVMLLSLKTFKLRNMKERSFITFE